MIMFCNIDNRQEPWLSLNYCMKCKRHVIALLYRYVLAIVVAIVCEMTPTQWWRSRCCPGDNGDHDVALEMGIKITR